MPFELPTDCREIIYGGDSFTFRGWEKAWATTQMFRVSGLTDALAPLEVRRDQIEAVDLVKRKIYERVPAQWKAFMSPDAGAHGAWGPLGDPQIERHIRHSLPQLLDRALLSIVYVITFIEDVCRAEVPRDFFDHVCIVPTPFSVVVETLKFWETHVEGQPLRELLATAIAPCPEFVAAEALRDRKRLTFRNAQLIAEALTNAGHRAQIVCLPAGRPHGATKEVLTESRKVAHPAVMDYLPAA